MYIAEVYNLENGRVTSRERLNHPKAGPGAVVAHKGAEDKRSGDKRVDEGKLAPLQRAVVAKTPAASNGHHLQLQRMMCICVLILP